MAPESEAAELQSLISEYGDGTNTTSNADVAEFAKTMQPVVDYVNNVKAEEQQKRAKAEVKDIVGFFSKEEGLKGIPDKLKRGFLEVHAQENADFGLAFDNKAKNPKAWQAAKKKARDALTEIASKIPGSKGRTDVGGPSPEQAMKMNAWEWREYLDEKYDR